MCVMIVYVEKVVCFKVNFRNIVWIMENKILNYKFERVEGLIVVGVYF